MVRGGWLSMWCEAGGMVLSGMVLKANSRSAAIFEPLEPLEAPGWRSPAAGSMAKMVSWPPVRSCSRAQPRSASITSAT